MTKTQIDEAFDSIDRDLRLVAELSDVPRRARKSLDEVRARLKHLAGKLALDYTKEVTSGEAA